MDWNRVIEQALGVLLGGTITIAGLWFKELFDRQRSIQSWYEQTFITEGVDRLILHLSVLDDALYDLSTGVSTKINELAPYPHESVERLRMLFPRSGIYLLRDVHQQIEGTREGIAESRDLLLEGRLIKIMRKDLIALHRELLGVRIRSKNEIYDIQNNKRVTEAYAEMEKHTNETLTALSQARKQA